MRGIGLIRILLWGLLESERLNRRAAADRFLAATAVVYQLTLVTADTPLFACRDISLLRNKTGAGHRNVPEA